MSLSYLRLKILLPLFFYMDILTSNLISYIHHSQRQSCNRAQRELGMLWLSLPDGSSFCCGRSLEKRSVLFWVSYCWLCPFALFIRCAVPRVKSKCWRMDSVALSAGKRTQVGMAKVLHQLWHTLLLVLLSGLCGNAELCQPFRWIHVQRMTSLLHTINSGVCV